MAVLVEGQVADPQDRLGFGGLRGARAAHEPAQPRDDLLEAERLGDVVVTAGRETGDAVADRVLRRQEQHGHVVAGLAQPLQHRHAVEVGHHDVEHHRVRVEVARGLQRVETGSGGADLPPLHPQRHRQQVGQHLLVVDDEHPESGTVRRRSEGADAVVVMRPIVRAFLCASYGASYAMAVRSDARGHIRRSYGCSGSAHREALPSVLG